MEVKGALTRSGAGNVKTFRGSESQRRVIHTEKMERFK